MFDEWLREWWEGYEIAHVVTELNTSCITNPLDIIARYLPTEALDEQGDALHNTIEFLEVLILRSKKKKIYMIKQTYLMEIKTMMDGQHTKDFLVRVTR